MDHIYTCTKKMQEKGPAVSSDAAYMVLGFLSLLFPFEKDKHQHGLKCFFPLFIIFFFCNFYQKRKKIWFHKKFKGLVMLFFYLLNYIK